MNRRHFLVGAATATILPRMAAAQARPDREHRIDLDVPVLAEEPASIPIRVAVDHPMDPDHFIRSIDVSIERDPVPAKGRLLLGPGNGRAWIAFQVRSGTGGLVRAVVTCSRHGEFAVTQEVRVVEGGCSTPPERGGKERAGQPEIRLPRSIRVGEVIEVRTRVQHASHTGLDLRDGKFVRLVPEYYVRQMVVLFDDQPVSEFQMTSAVSPNPLIRFPLKVTRAGTLRVQFVNSEGQRWEASQPIRL